MADLATNNLYEALDLTWISLHGFLFEDVR